MGSLHSALVALTGICVAVFVVAWIAGAVHFGVKGEAGSRGWARGLRRTLPQRALLIAGC
jgi:hypothetical protein